MGRRGWVLTRGGAPQFEITPLHVAAGEGGLEVAQSLLEAGANKNATALPLVGAPFYSRFTNSEM